MTQPVMTLPDGTTLREGDWAKLRNGDVVGPIEKDIFGDYAKTHPFKIGFTTFSHDGCIGYRAGTYDGDIIAKATNPNTAVVQLNAKDATPILWRDMTDAEKGMLLLAHHESPGSVEFWNETCWSALKCLGWLYNTAYRIRPEPKRETMTLHGGYHRCGAFQFAEATTKLYGDTHRITFDTIDGQPVAGSVKLERLT